jgi:hypothetical protein
VNDGPVLAWLLALTIAAGAHTPQDAVRRFVQHQSAADACAQLSPAYLKSIERRYGPCVVGIAHNPKVTHLILSHVAIHGSKATLQADYRVPSGPIRETYTLVRIKGSWRITGSR